MSYTHFNADVENVSHLSDLPNADEGLSAEQLKAVFDKAGVDIKAYINGTLIPELDSAGYKTFTVTFPSGQTTYNYSSSSYGLTARSNVFCQPADGSEDLWIDNQIKCSAVATNKITFTAATAPDADVSIKVLVMN